MPCSASWFRFYRAHERSKNYLFDAKWEEEKMQSQPGRNAVNSAAIKNGNYIIFFVTKTVNQQRHIHTSTSYRETTQNGTRLDMLPRLKR